MAQSSIRGVLADTCFWIAAFDSRDKFHRDASELLGRIRKGIILMPWPVMYETLGTRMLKNNRESFAKLFGGKIHRIDDRSYRDKCLTEALMDHRPLSLVDRILREIIQRGEFRITELLTVNHRDFADVCRERRLSIWSPGTSKLH